MFGNETVEETSDQQIGCEEEEVSVVPVPDPARETFERWLEKLRKQGVYHPWVES